MLMRSLKRFESLKEARGKNFLHFLLFEVLQREVQRRVIWNSHVVASHKVVKAAERCELHSVKTITLKTSRNHRKSLKTHLAGRMTMINARGNDSLRIVAVLSRLNFT